MFFELIALTIAAILGSLLAYVYYYHLPQQMHAARQEHNRTWTAKLNEHIAKNFKLQRDNERLRKENAEALKERLQAYNQGFMAGNLEASKRHNNQHLGTVALNA